MENLGFALQVSVIGIIALLVVLVALAGLISLMTKYLPLRPAYAVQFGIQISLTFSMRIAYCSHEGWSSMGIEFSYPVILVSFSMSH